MEFRNITSLNEIDRFNEIAGSSKIKYMQPIHYQYKDIDFMYAPSCAKSSESDESAQKKKLIILFHGAFSSIEGLDQIPVFRGYNYRSERASILSLSDKLAEIYFRINQGNRRCWYLSSKLYNFDSIYREIIQSIITHGGYQDCIFSGTSSGGFPAIYFASIFKQKSLVSNLPVCINKFCKVDLDLLNETAKSINDQINYFELDTIFEQYGLPSKLIVYSNVNDEYHFKGHIVPFEHKLREKFSEYAHIDSNLSEIPSEKINLINESIFSAISLRTNSLNVLKKEQTKISTEIKINYFIGEEPTQGRTHHTTYLPNNLNYLQLLEEL
jgi:hypothetical protein